MQLHFRYPVPPGNIPSVAVTTEHNDAATQLYNNTCLFFILYWLSSNKLEVKLKNKLQCRTKSTMGLNTSLLQRKIGWRTELF